MAIIIKDKSWKWLVLLYIYVWKIKTWERLIWTHNIKIDFPIQGPTLTKQKWLVPNTFIKMKFSPFELNFNTSSSVKNILDHEQQGISLYFYKHRVF